MSSTITDRLQGLSTSVAVKGPCRAVSTTNITLAGLQTIGSVSLAEDDRVLVVGQTDASENGIYNASTGDWQRAKDFDGNRDVVQGTLVLVVSAGLYEVTTANPIGIGTTEISFSIRTVEVAVPINVRSYGLVPNSTAARSANTAALLALIAPAANGGAYAFTGEVQFPNSSGADIYYFNDIIPVRDGIHIDLCGSTLHFSKTYAASDDTMGFLTFIRDVSIENGSIEVDYNGTGGTNPGFIMRIGSRSGYKFGSYTSGIFDKDDLADHGLPPMGNIVLRNLRLKTNNPNAAAAAAILLLGGLENVVAENIVFEGNGAGAGPGTVFYYEFGFASNNGFPSTSAQWSSSHAHGIVFRNIVARNLYAVAGDSYAVALVEAFSALVENVHSENCYGTFEFRIGEAHFFRPWTPNVGVVKRGMTLKNITAANPSGIGILLNAAQGTSGGYLNDTAMTAAGLTPLTNAQKVDLMKFSLDGFSISGPAGAGIRVGGAATICNGSVIGAFNGFLIDGDCPRFNLVNVEVLDSTGVGIRASDAAAIFTNRKKFGAIRCSKVCGSVGAGIALDSCESVLVEYNQLGYSTAFDNANEATQNIGVSVGSVGNGVRCDGNYVTVSGGGTAYTLATTGDRGCNIVNARSTRSKSGDWKIDGVIQQTTTNLTSITHAVNTLDKYSGKEALDTTAHKFYTARGPAAGDLWDLADGSASITPV